MTLALYAEARPVATIETDREGPRLRYEEDWRGAADAFAVSLSMPLAAAEHGPDLATPWLMNLLPEGEPLRAMTRALGVARDDVLGLIAETGRDLAGALSIGERRAGEVPATAGSRIQSIWSASSPNCPPSPSWWVRTASR